MRSIRFKITAISVSAFLATMLVVLLVCIPLAREESDRESVETMRLIGSDTQKALGKYFDGIEKSIELASFIASDTLDSIVLAECGVGSGDTGEIRTAEQQEVLDAYLSAYCSMLDKEINSIASHTNGVVADYYCINPEVSKTVHGFLNTKHGKSGFNRDEPIDASKLDPEDTEHNAWYFTSIRRGRPAWVGPYKGTYLQDMLICSYSVPIYKAGALIGLLGMDIPLEVLTDQVRTIRVYDTGFACLLDEKGQILYHPSLEYGSETGLALLPVYEEMLHQKDSGDQLIRYTIDGEERQLAYCTMENGFKLVIVAPVKEINASWTRLFRLIVPITVAAIILFAVVLLFAMGAITRPLQALTKASQRLANAEYDVELDYRGRDEVGVLTRAFSRMRDQIRQSIDDLNHRLNYDSLTDLPNLHHFRRLAREEKSRILSAGGSPAIVVFNLNGMRHFNRQYGFEEGDRLLCFFAEILSRHFGTGRVSRIGQDQFAALAEEAGLEEEIRAVFAECQEMNEGKTLPVRAGIYPESVESVGVSVACDRAKYAGDLYRSSYFSGFRYFDSKMLSRLTNARYVISHLDEALEKHWIKVYYQPIVRASSGRVCDEEALSRWIDPEKGFLSPGEFIPALEEANLIYKLDLYVVEQILEKMKRQAQEGLYVVPNSVNLSRADFDSCDIVEEICRRVDESGIGRDKLTIEITESIIGSDFDFMKSQVERFRELGFSVWMDDFGSGYSSLDVLQHIHFDLIKFDMRFMENFEQREECKVILTELVKMAIGLGVETVCEGVETKEQLEFLREIGCSKIQGYYFCKPIPPEEIIERNRKGIQIGFENPEETPYYAMIGGINLYDMAVISGGAQDDDSFSRYFDTLPMVIIEVKDNLVKYTRCNRSYREFLRRTLGIEFTSDRMDFEQVPDQVGATFMQTVLRCSRDGNRAIVDERVGENRTIHSYVRRLAENPVTGTVAVAAVILAVMEDEENAGMNYIQVAKALSADYVNLYYVDLETEKFVEYSPDPAREDLTAERRGDHFFAVSREDALVHIYKEDQEPFINAFRKENVEKALDTQGAFTLTYRLLIDERPVYVNLKAVRMQRDKKHIIIGVNNVDGQMRQQEVLEKMRAEEVAFARIAALAGDYICIYIVDPETNRYIEYNASGGDEGLGLARQGEDFFNESRRNSAGLIYAEDLRRFYAMFTKENILREIEQNGIFALRYRLMMGSEPVYCNVKGAMLQEQEGPKLIIGVNNVDSQTRREQEYERMLYTARSKANLDTLTGVKNRSAYENMSNNLAHQIEEGEQVRYAIAICRVNGLDEINETKGREEGDRLLKEACAVICKTFKHSPVFRVAGAEFAAVAQGHDYEHVDELVAELVTSSHEGDLAGTVITCGMAKYDGSGNVASVFERADALCRRYG